jgi:3-hydroxyisobutyrate dehydrogenase-like beta-hydroxyacid dehydrogenase
VRSARVRARRRHRSLSHDRDHLDRRCRQLVAQQLRARIIAGNFEPGFYVKHFIKDMEIALAAAREMGLATPGLELALRLYRRLADAGYGEAGTQALYRLYSETEAEVETGQAG